MISKQEITIVALKQRSHVSEVVGKWIRAEKQLKKLKQTKEER